MWNHKGDFVFVCQKSNPISRENTKPGVTVIRLANKYPCPFLLAKLTMKDTLLECKINANISFSSITKDYSLLKDFKTFNQLIAFNELHQRDQRAQWKKKLSEKI